MGKPFSNELEQLGGTYEWALSVDISQPVIELKNHYSNLLLVVGSGGSYSAAEFQATLHRLFFSSIAMAVTPVEMISALPRDGSASVWVLSASGNNIDIRRAFQHAALSEPKSVCALVGREQSKLKQINERYHYTNVYEYPLPAGKDGFLASNSLLGFATLLLRIYASASNTNQRIPGSLGRLISDSLVDHESLDSVELILGEVCKTKVVHVVYSERYKSIAVDIESKFVEAGLGSVHLADMRNFAHGRHHWFDKNPENSAILFLTSEHDRDLAQRTLDLLPGTLAKQLLVLRDLNGLELVAGILLSLYMTHWRGVHFGIDPGRPGVPEYGSKIYRLSANAGFAVSVNKERAACQRKMKTSLGQIDSSVWTGYYRQFLRKLKKQAYRGLVLDYDGTLVDGRHRGEPPGEDICRELNRLLAGGMTIGFATGRGKSIRKELRSPGVIEERYWDSVVIGYYNGSEIGYLSDEDCPDQSAEPQSCFDGVESRINQVLGTGSQELRITPRKFQLTVETKVPIPEVLLWDTVCSVIESHYSNDLAVVRSSHSVDILPRDISKNAVVEKLAEKIGVDSGILTIGDRGRWPGNDSALLSTEYSLSVDEVSALPGSCWNLCPAGVRGPQGTLHYLQKIECGDGVAYLR
ncbi:sucrose-6-phosphate hydrolase [Pseudohalioglobus lutimaris]|jgi:hydroxymethylpyrimidine pyrophosphatase-like HAD family hydrolase/fructoselysine-6-P-deglycase FrlB-like protein|uniref:Sucrose-6-phosphate hydrolase n=1 Tax=Pseudohalioglobus lutimaris TaxID=1737061 RepID=A0A2N5WZT9_9GAMM|nr:sucrose-6-phosphate hydrolase [Pseudohalioglobus lutimaris]PLW67760.1 sucrose-6-phosphate hydrolase [Pseudohalioglobus lutimaris]